MFHVNIIENEVKGEIKKHVYRKIIINILVYFYANERNLEKSSNSFYLDIKHNSGYRCIYAALIQSRLISFPLQLDSRVYLN